MNYKYNMRPLAKLFIPIFIIGILIGSSCKKTTETTTTVYMTGNLTFSIPEILIVSSPVQLSATGITVPETGITYSWTTTGFSVDSFKVASSLINAPSVIGNYTVTVVASHADYSSKSISLSTTVIDPSSADSYSGPVYGTNSITDARDGKKYYYSTIGSLDWFSSNLNWAGAGKPYRNLVALAPIFGRLYSWAEATGGVSSNTLGGGPQGACPAGWSVPTKKDWENFAKTLNGNTDISFDSNWPNLGGKVTISALLNSSNVWKYSPKNNKSNLFFWNALPGGSISDDLSRFYNLYEYGFWWSSTEKDAANAEYRYIFYDSPDFPYNFVNKSYFGASVRCVRIAH